MFEIIHNDNAIEILSNEEDLFNIDDERDGESTSALKGINFFNYIFIY